MGSFYDEIPPNIAAWILRQHIFFVATCALPSTLSDRPSSSSQFPKPADEKDGEGGQARSGWTGNKDDVPLFDEAYPNLSPKDMDGFVLDGSERCWYQDLTGSGVQTIAHLRQPGNNRMTIMFVAFERGPRIVRLFGKAKAYERTTPEFEKFLPPGDERIRPGCRAIIVLEITKVGSSCGFSIPFFDYKAERPTLEHWAKMRIMADLGISNEDKPKSSSPESRTLPESIESELSDVVRNGGVPHEYGLRTYWQMRNARSIEGLEGLKVLASGEKADVSVQATKKTGVDVLSPRRPGVGVGFQPGSNTMSGSHLAWVVAALIVGLILGSRGTSVLSV